MNKSIYKKTGAAQFSLIPLRRNGKKYRNGCVLLEASACTDFKNKIYDWQNKISFALAENDICTILDSVDIDGYLYEGSKPVRLIHKPGGDMNAPAKILSFIPGEGAYEGTWRLILENQENKDSKPVMVPLSRGEMRYLMLYIQASIPYLHGMKHYEENEA